MWTGWLVSFCLAGGSPLAEVEPKPTSPSARTTHWLGTGVAGGLVVSADGIGGFPVLPTFEWQVLSRDARFALDVSTTHLWTAIIVAGVFYGDLAVTARGRWPVGERAWFTVGGGPELAFAGALFDERGNASIGLGLKAGVDLHTPGDRAVWGLRWRGFAGPSLNDLAEAPVLVPLGAEVSVKWKLRPNR